MQRFCSSICVDRVFQRTLAVLASGLFCLPAMNAFAGRVEITPEAGLHASVPIKSMRELKFRAVVRQQFDFSCGSAAVATLLTYHYGSAVSEQSVFLSMYEKGNKPAIQREGFSLLDMKLYLEGQGYAADGLYASLDELAAIGIPAIVLVEVNGYKHFVVIKGLRGGELIVGDPAAGLKLYRRSDFEKIWTNGIVFVVRNKLDVAKNNFNSEWRNIARAPLDQAIARDTLSNITILRPGANDF